MRKSAQYLVASSLAAALVGGLAFAATKLPTAQQPMVYCSSLFGQSGFAKCPPTPMMYETPTVFGEGDSAALGTPPVVVVNNHWPQSNEVLANCQPLPGMPKY